MLVVLQRDVVDILGPDHLAGPSSSVDLEVRRRCDAASGQAPSTGTSRPILVRKMKVVSAGISVEVL